MSGLTRRAFLRDASAAALGVAGIALLGGCSQGTQTAATTSSAAEAREKVAALPLLAIIHTNDTHGHDVEVAATSSSAGNFSMAAVAQLKTDYEAKGYDVLLLDSGDAIQDDPLVDQSKGQAAIDFMNACGYRAMAMGNHEFDWGFDNLRSLRDRAKFPFLSANVLDESGSPVLDERVMLSLSDGTRVGVFGLTTPATSTMVNPSKIGGLTFLAGDELYACAQAQVDALRKDGCALVVCLGHLGGAGSVAPNRSYDVLERVSGIDLLVDGHDHLVSNALVGGALDVETGCYMHNIGLVTLEQGVISEQLVAYGTYRGVDPGVEAIIQTANDQVNTELGLVLGHTSYILDGARDPGVRTRETNLGDLVADAYLWEAALATGEKVDGAILNGGSIRTTVDAGDVTLRQIKAVLPYDGQIVTVKLTGAQLLEALEASTFQTPKALGGFPQVAGITFTVDTSKPYENGAQYPSSVFYAPAKPGTRVTIKDVGGRGFSTSDTYSIATNDFVSAGGDAYAVIAQAVAENGLTGGDSDYEALAGYLSGPLAGEVGEAYAAPQGRITIVG